jgi:hypothetical protein
VPKARIFKLARGPDLMVQVTCALNSVFQTRRNRSLIEGSALHDITRPRLRVVTSTWKYRLSLGDQDVAICTRTSIGFFIAAPCSLAEVTDVSEGRVLMMEATSISETSLNYQTTRRNNLEDRHFHTHTQLVEQDVTEGKTR